MKIIKKVTTKDEFVKKIAKNANFTIGDVQDILNEIITEFQIAISEEREIMISGFGSLQYKTRKPMKASKLIKEKTGLDILPEHKVAYFKLSKKLKEVMSNEKMV